MRQTQNDNKQMQNDTEIQRHVKCRQKETKHAKLLEQKHIKWSQKDAK